MLKFMSDWIVLALALGLACGGIVAGRRMGAIAACWLAGGAWLAFLTADRLWRAAVAEMRNASPELNLETWLPASYQLLFIGMLIPTIIMILLAQPKKDVPLPPKVDLGFGMAGGFVTAMLLLLAALQSQVMTPEAKERMPRAMGAAIPVLNALGQKHLGTPAQTPAKGGGN